MTKARSLRLAAAPILCAIFVSACGTTTIDQSSEVSLAREGLTKTNAGPARSVSCPSGVAAKVGATLNCHLVLVNGGSVTFTERVDSISGSNGHLTIIAAKGS